MKKIFLIILTLILSTNKSYALNFNENLIAYYNKNKGCTSMIYVLNRCSGVTGYLHSMLEQEPNQQQASKIYLNISSTMTSRASEAYSKHSKIDINKSMDENLKRAVSMMKLYQADAKENFLKTGAYINGIVKEDLDYCVSLEKEFRK